MTTETQHHPPIILHVMGWVALRLAQTANDFYYLCSYNQES
ncbi:hypothetical protein N44_02506 [Microcystis aeruginosa NIES-44]|uniref:Uncharacterized protein n=1 Tax=Microcystis aeruginosa NIES-44 TaxID=449439 RepID=A0A0A1VXF2_MICAE|nr:hypothetical protein N44_02506 [Microcystis aeruginosa NIES-44]